MNLLFLAKLIGTGAAWTVPVGLLAVAHGYAKEHEFILAWIFLAAAIGYAGGAALVMPAIWGQP